MRRAMTSGLDRADDKRGKRASDGAASTTASATVPAATIAISARTSTTSTSNPSPTADRRPKPLRPGSATAAAAAAEYHPLSPSGTPRAHLARRVSSAEPAGYFDVAPRRHAASVSAVTTPGPASPASPAVAALQAVAASAAGGLAPRRVDDLLGLGIESGPSRRRRSVEPGSRPSAASLFGDEETPRRPRRALGSWAGYLDSLSRDEIEVLDTPFDVMSDSELLAALRSFGHAREGRKSSRRGSGSPTRRDTARTSNGDSHASPSPSPTKSALSSTPPQSTAAPLFPPSPPGPAVAHAEHPLRVLSRAVRELREVIARLEVENARLKDSAAPPLPAATLAAHTGARRFSSGSSALFSASNTPSAEASPRPVPLQSVAERPTDQLHDSLADALSTSLTSPTHTHLALMEPREPRGDDDRSVSLSRTSRSPTPSVISGRRSPVPSTRSRGRASSVASSTLNMFLSDPVNAEPKDKDKKGWGIWGWGKKAGRKGSVSSLAPSVAASVAVEDDEWRRGDGGSAPSYRAIFLATRILTPDTTSILIDPARANTKVAELAHALVSNARDEGITVRDPPGRPRARSRAASNTSAKQAQAPQAQAQGSSDESSASATPVAAGYGDQALAATVGLGRTLLSLSRGKDEPKRRPALAPARSRGTTVGIYSAQPSPLPRSPSTPAADTPPPSVELGTIVPDEARPPTVLLSRQNLGSFFQSSRSKLTTATRFESDEPPLTDRYGFIYDIQHASMLKDASRAGTPAPISLTGHMPETGKGQSENLEIPIVSRSSSRESVGRERENERERERELGGKSPVPTPATASTTASASPALSDAPKMPDSIVDSLSPNGSTQGRRRPPALSPSHSKPTAAQAELTISVRGASSLGAESTSPPSAGASTSTKASRLTVSSLLDQLTDIHDKQQKLRTTEWDNFLRRRTRKRTSSERRGAMQDVGVSGAIAGVVALAGTQSKTGQEEYRLFQRLVRRGIPIPYRADVWAECSGARDLLVPGEYSEILAVHKDDYSPVMAEIEKDVGRTFPGNVFFGGDGPGVAKLRRVLVAYAWHNPAVGYCQGMNMLAATLLLTHTDEEQAFWVLHCMIERLLPADFYSPSLVGSRADQAALADLVVQHVPRVAVHFAELGVDLTSVTFGWFLSLFTDCLPVETLFRVWDVFFVEGHAVLFRVAVAVLKLNEAELCATDSVPDLFTFIGGMTARLWSADKLIALQHSYRSAMRDADVQALVEWHARALQRELDGDSE